MPLADFTFGNVLLTVLEIFLFVAWLWVLFGVFGDLFRDHELSGWGKAGWIFLLFILPFLGVLIYLIARGQGMRDRAVAEQAEMRKQMDAYVRDTAGGGSAADELHKLSELKDKGAISDAEFEQMKAKVLA
jgi:Short C-terminal domain/Phospholipase_D-nuclease N-terminal